MGGDDGDGNGESGVLLGGTMSGSISGDSDSGGGGGSGVDVGIVGGAAAVVFPP